MKLALVQQHATRDRADNLRRGLLAVDRAAAGGAQVVCFAVPHPKLGEEVGAAVVLKEGASATEKDIQTFVATRVADFKVPKKILILPEIPKGATGKLQRIGLAQKLGLA